MGGRHAPGRWRLPGCAGGSAGSCRWVSWAVPRRTRSRAGRHGRTAACARVVAAPRPGGVPGVAGLEHHEGLDQLGALRARLADHRRLDHRGVLDQRAFHVKGADPVAGGGDHVIRAADEGDAAVGIQFHGVAAQVIVADEGPGGGAGEPEQRRAGAVNGEDARLPAGSSRWASSSTTTRCPGTAKPAAPMRTGCASSW